MLVSRQILLTPTHNPANNTQHFGVGVGSSLGDKSCVGVGQMLPTHNTLESAFMGPTVYSKTHQPVGQS